MKPQSGFTLIEAMVTGLISTILAATILSVLYMGNDLISTGYDRIQLNELQAVAASQIIRSGRSAYAVKRAGDPLGTIDTSVLNAEPIRLNEKEIVFCARSWDTLGGYRVNQLGYLEEIDTSTTPPSWIPFRVGTDTVDLDTASGFTIWSRRRGVDMRLRHIIRGGADSLLAVVTERVLCRSHAR